MLKTTSQAVIFLLKREFMLIGWMVVYILSCVFCALQTMAGFSDARSLQVPGVQFLPPDLRVLVHGRLQLG